MYILHDGVYKYIYYISFCFFNQKKNARVEHKPLKKCVYLRCRRERGLASTVHRAARLLCTAYHSRTFLQSSCYPMQHKASTDAYSNDSCSMAHTIMLKWPVLDVPGPTPAGYDPTWVMLVHLRTGDGDVGASNTMRMSTVLVSNIIEHEVVF